MALITRADVPVFLMRGASALVPTGMSVYSQPGPRTTARAADQKDVLVLPGSLVSLQHWFKLFVCGWFALLLFLAGTPLQAQAASLTLMRVDNYSVLGKPTVSANFINRVLSTYHSPAAGKGQALYDDGVKYGIDPVFALAFFLHESTFGTTGIARVTLSLGNIRTPVTSNCRCQAYHRFRRYNSWEDGFLDWYKLIRKLYVTEWGLTTVDQIIPVYAPASENNVLAYIGAIKHAVVTWRGKNTPKYAPNVEQQPEQDDQVEQSGN